MTLGSGGTIFMIIIKNKKCSIANIKKEYPDAIIIDVTSKATDDFVKLSPFYPVGGIPVPGKEGMTSMSVEDIWQGLKMQANPCLMLRWSRIMF